MIIFKTTKWGKITAKSETNPDLKRFTTNYYVMTTVKYNNYNFRVNFNNPNLEDFVENNIDYYADLWMEANPQLAYKINDWDLEWVYDSIDYYEIKKEYEEIFHEFLEINN